MWLRNTLAGIVSRLVVVSAFAAIRAPEKRGPTTRDHEGASVVGATEVGGQAGDRKGRVGYEREYPDDPYLPNGPADMPLLHADFLLLNHDRCLPLLLARKGEVECGVQSRSLRRDMRSLSESCRYVGGGYRCSGSGPPV